MDMTNYKKVNVTDYLRKKYGDALDDSIKEVSFYEDTSTDIRWIKVVKEEESNYGPGIVVSKNYLNGQDCELDIECYDDLDETIFEVCDNANLLYYDLDILATLDIDLFDDEESGEATVKEMKEEALNRIKLFDKMEPCVARDFKNNGTLYMSENHGALYWLSEEEKELVNMVEKSGDRVVYHVLHYATQYGEMYTMLYVYKDKSEWKDCRENLKNYGQSYCYIYNKDEPAFSEHGSIGVVQVNGGLMVNNNIFGMAL